MAAPDGSSAGEHLSIGEVLSLLREEFPDITISKIRFLESQGLIVPERTASGYRMFFEPDIETLRWVLRQQRDHFLPLKVIKAKLDSRRGGALAPDLSGTDAQPSLFGGPATTNGRPAATDAPAPTGGAPSGADDPPAAAPEDSSASDASPAEDVIAAALSPSTAPGGAAPADRARTTTGPAPHDPAAWLAALQESPDPHAPDPVAPSPRPTGRITDFATHPPETTYTQEQLAAEAGVDLEAVAQLAEYGLLVGSKYAGESVYDEAGLAVVRAASAILGRGVEARHLRGYKLGAEREVALFEQMILPLLRQRNPEARQQAQETLDEMCAMGQDLREALITQALRAQLRRG
jgi:DNA-binding transcriptional MerR regulator